MKHVLDQSTQSQTLTARRYVYAKLQSMKPSAPTLTLQRRAAHKKTHASGIRAFLRIDRYGGG